MSATGKEKVGKQENDAGKVFVGGLSRETTTSSLQEYFEGFGEISDCVVMIDRITGLPRGFGFVTYASHTIADRVVLNRHVINGKEVEAKPAVPRVCAESTSRGGTGPVPPEIMPMYAGVVLGDACHGTPMEGGGACPGMGGRSPVEAARPHGNQEMQSRPKKIFVGGLAHETSEADFRSYFGQFGAVADCVIMCDPHTRKPRGFGFVTYESPESVELVASNTFHELSGKRVEVKRAVPPGQPQAALPDDGAPRGHYGRAYQCGGYPGHSGEGSGEGGRHGEGRHYGGPYGGPGMGQHQEMGMRPPNGHGFPRLTAGQRQRHMGSMLPSMHPSMRVGPSHLGGPALSGGMQGGMHDVRGGGVTSPVDSSAALDAALSTANSVLSQALLVDPEPSSGGDEDAAPLPAVGGGLCSAFSSGPSNYSSATASLSAGVRSSYDGQYNGQYSGQRDGRFQQGQTYSQPQSHSSMAAPSSSMAFAQMAAAASMVAASGHSSMAYAKAAQMAATQEAACWPAAQPPPPPPPPLPPHDRPHHPHGSHGGGHGGGHGGRGGAHRGSRGPPHPQDGMQDMQGMQGMQGVQGAQGIQGMQGVQGEHFAATHVLS